MRLCTCVNMCILFNVGATKYLIGTNNLSMLLLFLFKLGPNKPLFGGRAEMGLSADFLKNITHEVVEYDIIKDNAWKVDFSSNVET